MDQQREQANVTLDATERALRHDRIGQEMIGKALARPPLPARDEAREHRAKLDAQAALFPEAIKALKEFVRFADLPPTVARGDYIRYQCDAIAAARDVLSKAEALA